LKGVNIMKKRLSKTLSALLAVLLFIPVLPSASALTPAEAAYLQFQEDGKFTIMQVADIQDGPGLMLPTSRFLKKVVADIKPDLVVLTGDNIFGSMSRTDELTENAIGKIMTIFKEAGVPVAVTFGNHDDEGGTTKEKQMQMYMAYDNCVAYDEGEDVYGVGNYNVPIYSSKNQDKVAYNLWFIDSGTYDDVNGGYDYVRQSQIDWYVGKSNELKAANGGVPVESMMFQHIVIPEVYNTFSEVPFGTEGAVAVGGKFYVLNPEMTLSGELGEGAYPSRTNGGLFDAVKAQGDVTAMFFGHDHVNTYEVAYEGVNLVCTPTAGMASYGDHNRGVRVITVDENDTSTYETYLVRYTDYFDSRSIMNFGYIFMKTFWEIAFPLQKLFYLIDSVFSLSAF